MRLMVESLNAEFLQVRISHTRSTYLKPEPFGIIRSICPPTKDSIDTSLSTQYTDGLYGPLIIHDPDATGIMALGKGYDEERILFMGDWYHTYSSVLLQQYIGNLFGKKEVDSKARPGMVSPCSRNRTATRHHPDQRMQQVELLCFSRPRSSDKSYYQKLHRRRVV